MHALDGLIVCAFAAYAIIAGLRSRRLACRGLEDYFLAGRSLNGWQSEPVVGPEEFDQLQEFYARARPPGF